MNAGWAFAFNRLYCFLVMVVSGIASAFFGFLYSQVDPQLVAVINKGVEMVPFLATTPFTVLAVIFGLVAVFDLILLLSPKTPFWWWMNFIHLLLGIISGACAPFAIVAIVGWVGEPLKKEFYGRPKSKIKRNRRGRK